MNEGDVHDAVRGLYEGILDPEAWRRSLSTVIGLAGSAHGSMMVWDTVGDHISVNEIVNPVAELFSQYESEFQAIDPAKSFAPRLAPGEWYVDTRELGVSAMARHPFYADFFHRHDLHSYVACLVERQPHYEVYFAMQRARSQEMFTPDDTARLAWLIPHMRAAIALRDRTLGLSTLAQLSSRLIERLGFAVIVMTPGRRVLLANQAGETWARRLEPAGKAAGWRLGRPFAAMVDAACGGSPLAAQATLAIGPDGEAAQVIVLPLPASHAFSVDWQQPAALVVVHRSGEAPLLLTRVLRDLYGLTPAECRIAQALSSGPGLPEVARQLNISHETARSQLKAIFIKTGTTSQSQLVHTLSRLAAALGDA